MRAVVIIDVPPGIEGVLGMCEIAQRDEIEHFGRQGPVEAFVLAAPLRVKGARIDRVDTQLEQPDPQPRP